MFNTFMTMDHLLISTVFFPRSFFKGLGRFLILHICLCFLFFYESITLGGGTFKSRSIREFFLLFSVYKICE